MRHLSASVGILFLALPAFASPAGAASAPATPVIRVSMVLHGDKLEDPVKGAVLSTLDLGHADAAEGKSSNLYSCREFPYPTSFDRPKWMNSVLPAGQNVRLAIPFTPREFVTQNVGWSVDLQATLENGLVCVQATSTYTALGNEGSHLEHGVYGEDTGPLYGEVLDPKTGKMDRVVLSPNHAAEPTFQKSVTPFFLVAKPGKSYVVKLQHGDEWIDATVKCEVL